MSTIVRTKALLALPLTLVLLGAACGFGQARDDADDRGLAAHLARTAPDLLAGRGDRDRDGRQRHDPAVAWPQRHRAALDARHAGRVLAAARFDGPDLDRRPPDD